MKSYLFASSHGLVLGFCITQVESFNTYYKCLFYYGQCFDHIVCDLVAHIQCFDHIV